MFSLCRSRTWLKHSVYGGQDAHYCLGTQPGDTMGPSLPGNGRTLLFLPFCRQSSRFSGDASQRICTGRSAITA